MNNLMTLARETILEQGSEDFLGFYEVLWEISPKHPAATDDEAFVAASTAGLELLEQGLVQVFNALDPAPDESPISTRLARAAICSKESWAVPSPESIDRFWFATPLG